MAGLECARGFELNLNIIFHDKTEVKMHQVKWGS